MAFFLVLVATLAVTVGSSSASVASWPSCEVRAMAMQRTGLREMHSTTDVRVGISDMASAESAFVACSRVAPSHALAMREVLGAAVVRFSYVGAAVQAGVPRSRFSQDLSTLGRMFLAIRSDLRVDASTRNSADLMSRRLRSLEASR